MNPPWKAFSQSSNTMSRKVEMAQRMSYATNADFPMPCPEAVASRMIAVGQSDRQPDSPLKPFAAARASLAGRRAAEIPVCGPAPPRPRERRRTPIHTGRKRIRPDRPSVACGLSSCEFAASSPGFSISTLQQNGIEGLETN